MQVPVTTAWPSAYFGDVPALLLVCFRTIRTYRTAPSFVLTNSPTWTLLCDLEPERLTDAAVIVNRATGSLCMHYQHPHCLRQCTFDGYPLPCIAIIWVKWHTTFKSWRFDRRPQGKIIIQELHSAFRRRETIELRRDIYWRHCQKV